MAHPIDVSELNEKVKDLPRQVDDDWTYEKLIRAQTLVSPILASQHGRLPSNQIVKYAGHDVNGKAGHLKSNYKYDDERAGALVQWLWEETQVVGSNPGACGILDGHDIFHIDLL